MEPATEDGARRRHPLEPGHRVLGGAPAAACTVALAPFRSLLNVRGDPADAAFLAAAAASFGVDLPLVPNRWQGEAERAAIWLGPDEWLVQAPAGEAAALEAALRAARPADPWLSVVDVSHNSIAFLLSGGGAPAVLARGCTLDLDPAQLGAGACAQTLLAKTPMLLRFVDEAPTYEVRVRNSFAQYTADWLAAALRTAGA